MSKKTKFYAFSSIKKYSLLLLFAFPCSSIAAGHSDTTKITNVLVNDVGVDFIYFASTVIDPVTCSSSNTRFAFDAKTATGKALLATALLVFATNKPVSFNGSGDCNVWGDTESLALISTSY